MEPYRATRVGPGGFGTRFDYAGPAGPMTVHVGGEGHSYRVEGPTLPGEGSLALPEALADFDAALREGIVATFAAVEVRLWRPRSGWSRRSRAIRAALPDGTASLRLRRWNAKVMEIEGRRVAEGGARGRIDPESSPVSVGTWLLVSTSGLLSELALDLVP
jgi:hypothetical protein